MEDKYSISFFFKPRDISSVSINGEFNVDEGGNGWFRCYGVCNKAMADFFVNDLFGCMKYIISNEDEIMFTATQIEVNSKKY